MAIKIRIIRSVDYLDITDEGEVNFPESRKALEAILQEEIGSDCDILLDYRRTQWVLSTDEIFQLVEVILRTNDAFRDRIALLLLPGVNFDSAHFRSLCEAKTDTPIRTFTNYEDAVQWFY